MTSLKSAPPVTDELPIAIRAYVTPTWRVLPEAHAMKRSRRRSSSVPASPWTLIFDTETTTDAAQSLRFGTYQLRHFGEVIESGIFYDPDVVTANEIAVLQCHANAHGLTLHTREEFADEVFFARGY